MGCLGTTDLLSIHAVTWATSCTWHAHAKWSVIEQAVGLFYTICFCFTSLFVAIIWKYSWKASSADRHILLTQIDKIQPFIPNSMWALAENHMHKQIVKQASKQK